MACNEGGVAFSLSIQTGASHPLNEELVLVLDGIVLGGICKDASKPLLLVTVHTARTPLKVRTSRACQYALASLMSQLHNCTIITTENVHEKIERNSSSDEFGTRKEDLGVQIDQ